MARLSLSCERPQPCDFYPLGVGLLVMALGAEFALVLAQFFLGVEDSPWFQMLSQLFRAHDLYQLTTFGTASLDELGRRLPHAGLVGVHDYKRGIVNK
ncbi:hypothetical protein PG996_013313 [Apiospora saccharicola]|uniref:Uncharacterized protein n=1 Tax=Apiospora saccharicola TaxID=335842 RepID=A0ABR1U547_9PEZI